MADRRSENLQLYTCTLHISLYITEITVYFDFSGSHNASWFMTVQLDHDAFTKMKIVWLSFLLFAPGSSLLMASGACKISPFNLLLTAAYISRSCPTYHLLHWHVVNPFCTTYLFGKCNLLSRTKVSSTLSLHLPPSPRYFRCNYWNSQWPLINSVILTD